MIHKKYKVQRQFSTMLYLLGLKHYNLTRFGNQMARTGEKIRHFYPLASRASGAKNPLALMIF